jgi:hypothetical protein
MRRHSFAVIGLVILFLATMGLVCSESNALVGGDSLIMIENIQGRKTTNGLFLALIVLTTDPPQAERVKSIRAWNTDPAIDPTIYTNWFQFNEVRKNTQYQFVIEVPYTGQYGSYDIEITYDDDSTEILTTLAINQWVNPYPAATGLEVDFSTGVSTPTFRFLPIDDPRIDYYQIRLRYFESPLEARMIYRTAKITSWTPGEPIEVIFPQSSDGQGTEEPLLPGVEYEVRVEAYDENGASPSPTWRASFRSEKRLYFRLPQGSVLYDDFTGPRIDRNKWRWCEFVREIDAVNQRLISKLGSPNPNVVGTYPYSQSNWLGFPDPNSVNSIQTDVMILENAATNSAQTRARLGGRWYNDGTSGEGMIGDIWAEVSLTGGPTGLKATWGVSRFTNADGTTWVGLGGGDFTTPISMGTTYPLYISYDSTANQLKFRVGTEEVIFGPTGLPGRVGDPKSPWKFIGTRVQIDNPTASAYISAAFDNVYRNGELYDNFSSPTIGSTKWTAYEFVREIHDGKLRSKIRSSSAYTSFVNNELQVVSPKSINTFQAKVTLLDYENPNSLFEVADISGTFFNDGTPGGGSIGDIVGQVLIGGTGTNPIAAWQVYKYTDVAGNVAENVASGGFTTPIALGNTYTLFLSWNGSMFTFRIDDEEAHYTPVISINPVHGAFKRVRTKIEPAIDKKEGTIEALFDDVMVIGPSGLPGDANGDGRTTIDEVQKAINQFLGISSVEPYCDLNRDGHVTIDEVQKVINAFLGL